MDNSGPDKFYLTTENLQCKYTRMDFSVKFNNILFFNGLGVSFPLFESS